MTEQTHTGGCHCGAVRFEVEADFSGAIACNCSLCETKGLILAFAPREKFRLLAGGDKLTEYRFNRRQIAHRFCSACGTQPFSFAARPDGVEMAAVNLRCVDGIDLGSLSPAPFDGRSL